jgi:hypothetical protein
MKKTDRPVKKSKATKKLVIKETYLMTGGAIVIRAPASYALPEPSSTTSVLAPSVNPPV